MRIYCIDDPLVPSLHQPAQLLEYAATRDLLEPLLAGCGLDRDRLQDGELTLTPAQYARLIERLRQVDASEETSFALGLLALPGHFGGASQALQHAPNLRTALQLLVELQAQLSPLLVPHVLIEAGHAIVYWTDAGAGPALKPFLVEMQMSAVVEMCRWLSGQRWPWTFCFNRMRPRRSDQHEAHLGSRLRFGCQLDAMWIDASTLDRPWPRGSDLAVRAALDGLPSSRLNLQAALYDFLLARLRHGPSLPLAADHFGMSVATLKRRLARHATHFQAELDVVRTHAALHMFLFRSVDNEQVAAELGFRDAANFRRSFKRWTGQSPALLRSSLPVLQDGHPA